MSLVHKTKNQQRNNDPLIRLMTPMIAGILACVFCLVSMTWAWFTASVNTPTQTIKSATRSTTVIVYELEDTDPEKGTPVRPQTTQIISLADTETTPEAEATVEVSGRAVSWDLKPEKSYKIVMTGSGTATKGYCEVALTHTKSGETTPITTTYKTVAFENNHTVKFTYKTGGFESVDGVTNTQWTEYVQNTTPPTLTITSYWGQPAPAEQASQTKFMKLKSAPEEKIMLLSDGDVLGLAPIPCPEAKAETKVELEGFETEEGTVISAEEDYKVSLTLKEGYEMPSEVVVNIGGKDYVVSTGGAVASEDAPYYDAASGVLTVPSTLLSDGTKVSVKATATQIPVEKETEEEKNEETNEETTEEATENKENEEDNSADTPSDNNVVADNPTKKEEDSENSNVGPKKPITGGGGNGDDDDDDNNLGGSSNDNNSSSDSKEDDTEDEKADVTLNLSQLTINLEETKIPTNADLVLTLSAKEDMQLPGQIVITLDKTIRDENIDTEEITEDKTEYIINTDGKDNPEGFEFDLESGNLTISSELLEGVREITIADTEENEVNEDEEKATLTFEVKNLTFDFTDDEIVTDEDVVITFTAGEGYELPETIIITIDGEEYIIYTSEEDSDKNPEGITFDIETGTLTISKDLLKDAEAITIAAEGVKKEDEESEDKEENPDADKKDESEDKDNTDNGNESEGGEGTDKEPESGTDIPDAEDKTETEGGTDTPGGENTETTNPDNTTEGENNGENDGEDNGEDNGVDGGETETPEPGTEPTTPTTPDTEDNANTEQGGENVEIEEGEGAPTTPIEPTTPTEPSEPVVTPETPKTEAPDTSEPATGGNDCDNNGGTTNIDNNSAEDNGSSGNDSTESNASSESTTSASPSVTPTVLTNSTPAASEASQASGTTTSSGSKETSSEE